MLVVVAEKRCSSRRRFVRGTSGQFNSTSTVLQQGEEREQEQRLLQGNGAVEELCRIYRTSDCLSRTSLASATVVSAPRQFNRNRNSRSVGSIGVVNRKRSAVRRLQGLGPVENPCRIYRGSWSLPIGQALRLTIAPQQSIGRFNRRTLIGSALPRGTCKGLEW